MRKCWRSVAMAVLAICAALVMWWVPAWWTQRQWFALQAQQMATIRRLEAMPPPGWDRGAWRNALVTVNNVWGNVTYTPAYSKLTVAEMRALQTRLEQVLAETSPANSVESVDRVFALLLEQGRKTVFITGYREEFREYQRSIERGEPE
jgi:hypothetical protein